MSNQEQTELQQLIEQVGMEMAKERGKLTRTEARGLVERHRAMISQWDAAAWSKDERGVERLGQELSELRRVMTKELSLSQEDMFKTREMEALTIGLTIGPESAPEMYKTRAPAQFVQVGRIDRLREWFRGRQEMRRARRRLLEPVLSQAMIDGGLQPGERRLRGIGVISIWRRTID